MNSTVRFGHTGLSVPKIVFGTSAFGNLYRALSYEEKLEIARQWFAHGHAPVVLDSAGKYGAGLSLEMIGKTLRDLGIGSDAVVISNKLGWHREPMVGPEPTFETGVWHDIEYDASQAISHDGILACWNQGNELLGSPYRPQLVSVHDPDEYLAAATNRNDRAKRFDDVLGAYRALCSLRDSGEVAGVGVGSKDWEVIREITDAIELDWVMFACSMTVYNHPKDLLEYMGALNSQGIAMINSAVFNAGFLVGGSYFDYRVPDKEADAPLFAWREGFFDLCKEYDVEPADACIEFGLSVPGVTSIALNTSNPNRIQSNVASTQTQAPEEFWAAMKEQSLVDPDYPFLG